MNLNIVMISLCSLVFLSCQPQMNPDSTLPTNALPNLQTITMNIGGVDCKIEVALTMQEQQQGLMYRESMPENHGMLFVYSQPRYMSFWMKNTKIPLSIAYIREDSIIGNIEKMEPQRGNITPTEHYRSKYKSLYALEMNQGWFEKHGIKPGDFIEIPVEQIQMLRNVR